MREPQFIRIHLRRNSAHCEHTLPNNVRGLICSRIPDLPKDDSLAEIMDMPSEFEPTTKLGPVHHSEMTQMYDLPTHGGQQSLISAPDGGIVLLKNVRI
jgi:hypothetical protein